MAVNLPLSAPRSALGIADLYRCYGFFGAEALEELAPLLGFQRRPKTITLDSEKIEDSLAAEESDATKQVLPPAPEKTEFPFEPWHMTAWEPLDQETVSAAVAKKFRDRKRLEEHELREDYSQVMPSQAPLLPWSALWPFLRGALGGWQESGELCLSPIIKGLTTGRWPSRIPRKQKLAWSSACHVVLDTRLQLQPFQADFESLLPKLEDLRGKAGLHIWAVDRGPARGWRPWKENRKQPFPMPPKGTPVLILGDLGQYSDEVEPWLRFGKTLRRQGCFPVALVPCPTYLWHEELTKVWSMAFWDLGVRLPELKPGKRVAHRSARGKYRQRKPVTKLANLLSPAIFVEPGLLRAARKLLSAGKADVSSEYFFWNDPQGKRDDLGCALDPEDRKTYLLAFTSMGEERCKQLLQLICAYHAPHAPAVTHEELMTGLSLLDESHPEGEQYFLKMSRNAESAGPCFKAFIGDVGTRIPQELWEKGDGLALTWVMAHLKALDAGSIDPPEGLDTHRFPFAFDLKDKEKDWDLVLYGQQLSFLPTNKVSDPQGIESGKTLGTISERGGQLQLVDGKQFSNYRRPQQTKMNLAHLKACKVKTFTGIWTLKRLGIDDQPPWARVLGCDSKGLFAVIHEALGGEKIRWIPPGPLEIQSRDGESFGQWAVNHGFWMDEEQTGLFGGRIFRQPAWTSSFGLDSYGIFADANVENEIFRFRWIFPGNFKMGSQDDQPGRPERKKKEPWTDETEHPVTLTQGFWLGETTVTQSQWKAVMNENPSDFKGDDLPVERLSKEDCGEFIQRLNKQHPGMNLSLPTEAQWEYACRAGTTTIYNFGDAITTDQVNYDGSHPNNGSPKGVYRKRTVPVKDLPANDWGLYQMHGNVWEWCEDWLGEYQQNEQVNPVGPEIGRYRVMRGGAWVLIGKDCRSSVRGGFFPGLIYPDTGFRLARGQEQEETP